MVKANVDKILDVLRTKKTASLAELSKELLLSKEDLQKSAEYLEEDGVVKIEHKFPNVMVTMIKDPDMGSPALPVDNNSELKNIPSPKEMPAVNLRVAQPPLFHPEESKPSFETRAQPVQPAYPGQSQVFTIQQETVHEPPPIAEKKPDIVIRSERTIFENGEQEDPLEQKKPGFNLAAPSPDDKVSIRQERMGESGQTLSYSGEFAPKIEISFPKYVESKVDRIEYMVDMIHSKITKHEYKDLNVLYRQAYDLYKEAENLSPNERYLLGERLNDVFRRLKRIYLLESVV
jgi:hypothetical protein